MSKWDLNKVTDFQRVTMDPLAKVALALAGLNPAEWDVAEGSFRGVLFHIFKSKTEPVSYQGSASDIEDSGGRRKVKYVFPYRDGQTTDDLGRKAAAFKFNILIHGDGYAAGLKALIEAFDDPTSGDLVHPLRSSSSDGLLESVVASEAATISEVVVEDYTIVHSSERRKAALINVTFIEHNFNIGSFKDFQDLLGTFRRALNTCLGVFAAVDAIIATVTGRIALLQSLVALFNGKAETYKNEYAKVLTKLNRTFNQPKNSSATVQDSSPDIPALVPVNDGGLRNPDGTLASTTFRTVTSPSDPFANIPLSTLTNVTVTAVATQQAITEVDSLRIQAQSMITDLETSVGGQGALIFHDEINAIKSSSILMQTALETAIQASKSIISSYIVPRLMSLREVAFANGLTPDNAVDLEILNPSLLCTNHITAGTVVKVPLS